MKSGLYTVVHFLFAWLVRLCSHLRVVNRKNEPKRSEGPYIVVCNHLTWKDPIWLCAATRYQQPHFMAKKELFRPPLGPMIRALGAYPVDRGGADVGAIRKTIKMLEDGYCIGMFPQGHRNPGVDPRTTKIRPGVAMIAAHAGVKILPVYIKTKDNRPRAFRKKEIIIGKPFTLEELGFDPHPAGEYNRVAGLVFERICALGDETCP